MKIKINSLETFRDICMYMITTVRFFLNVKWCKFLAIQPGQARIGLTVRFV